MSIFDRIQSFEFDKNERKDFVKSAIVWGHLKNENTCQPILYISKPKHITEEEFQELLNSIDIKFLKQ